MKIIELVTLALLIAAAATSSGCPSAKIAEITEQELTERILTTVDKQQAYRFEMSNEGSITGTTEGEYDEISLIISDSGTIDVENQQMQKETNLRLNGGSDGQPEMVIVTETYVLDDIAYIGFREEPSQPNKWIKGAMSESLWGSQELLGKHVDILRESEVSILRTEKVNGISCYVVEISPTMEALRDLIGQQMGSGMVPDLTQYPISGYSYTGWYAADSFLPIRAVVEYDVAFQSDVEDFSAEYSMDVAFFYHDQPVSIQLPVEAQGAEYVGPIG